MLSPECCPCSPPLHECTSPQPLLQEVPRVSAPPNFSARACQWREQWHPPLAVKRTPQTATSGAGDSEDSDNDWEHRPGYHNASPGPRSPPAFSRCPCLLGHPSRSPSSPPCPSLYPSHCTHASARNCNHFLPCLCHCGSPSPPRKLAKWLYGLLFLSALTLAWVLRDYAPSVFNNPVWLPAWSGGSALPSGKCGALLRRSVDNLAKWLFGLLFPLSHVNLPPGGC